MHAFDQHPTTSSLNKDLIGTYIKINFAFESGIKQNQNSILF